MSDYETPYEKVSTLEVLPHGVIAFIADGNQIIVQRLADGLFTRIVTGILYPLRDLKVNHKELVTTDLSGRVQTWARM